MPSSGIELIAAERKRQMEAEGWTAEHDDTHQLSELSRAAMAYALLASKQACDPDANQKCTPLSWPWNLSSWRPSEDPIRNLVKAGALIAAEIDRLQRRGEQAQ